MGSHLDVESIPSARTARSSSAWIASPNEGAVAVACAARAVSALRCAVLAPPSLRGRLGRKCTLSAPLCSLSLSASGPGRSDRDQILRLPCGRPPLRHAMVRSGRRARRRRPPPAAARLADARLRIVSVVSAARRRLRAPVPSGRGRWIKERCSLLRSLAAHALTRAPFGTSEARIHRPLHPV